MNNPGGTVKVTANVMTRCKKVQWKAMLHVRVIRWSISKYILLQALPHPSSYTWGVISAATQKPGFQGSGLGNVAEGHPSLSSPVDL